MRDESNMSVYKMQLKGKGENAEMMEWKPEGAMAWLFHQLQTYKYVT